MSGDGRAASEDGRGPSGGGRGRALAVAFGIVFLDLLGFDILVPVIPLYALDFGASEFVGSLLIASYSAMQFLFAPVLGRLSDRRGRRPVLLLSLFGSVLLAAIVGPLGGSRGRTAQE